MKLKTKFTSYSDYELISIAVFDTDTDADDDDDNGNDDDDEVVAFVVITFGIDLDDT